MNPLIIRTARRVAGVAHLPGDKSISHRALILGAVAEGPGLIRGLSTSADVRATLECLRALGVEIEVERGSTRVAGRGVDGLKAPSGELWCANSGSTMRMLAGLLAGRPFRSILRGDGSLERRPMRRVAEPLEQMGASVVLSDEGTAPFVIEGRTPLRPIEYVSRVPSAQVKTAILLAGLSAEGETSVTEPVPTRDHTERMLGLTPVDGPEGRRVSIRGGMNVPSRDVVVPADPSSALFIACAAAVLPGSEVSMPGVGLNPGRMRGFDLAATIGLDWTIGERSAGVGEPVGTIRVAASDLGGELVIEGSDAAAVIDEIPALAVLAALGACSCTVRDAAELRVKETDRIRAVTENLRRLGVAVDEFDDGFAFEPINTVLGAPITTYADHRIAMAFAVAGLKVPGVVIDDPDCAAVSFPEFWNTLDGLRQE